VAASMALQTSGQNSSPPYRPSTSTHTRNPTDSSKRCKPLTNTSSSRAYDTKTSAPELSTDCALANGSPVHEIVAIDRGLLRRRDGTRSRHRGSESDANNADALLRSHKTKLTACASEVHRQWASVLTVGLGRTSKLRCACSRHQKCQYTRHDKKGCNVTEQMADVLRVDNCLDCHDRPMDDARPDRKPDQADVCEWVARCTQEEYPERGVDGQDHLQVLRLAGMPRPSRGPNDRERVNAEQEDQPHQQQRDSQVFDTFDVRHDALRSVETNPCRCPRGTVQSGFPNAGIQAGHYADLSDHASPAIFLADAESFACSFLERVTVQGAQSWRISRARMGVFNCDPLKISVLA